MPTRGRSHVDVVVGHNIRIHRLDRGLSQTDLGKHLGVTFQQVQKYENGVNRVGSGNLFKIAGALGVPITTFYEGVEDADGESGGGSPVALLAEPYALRLLQAFSSIDDSELRKSFVEVAERFSAKLKPPVVRRARNGTRRRKRR
jgi:transcriptional regulator with XRE-family HTH domain